jgi:hypothetical protein
MTAGNDGTPENDDPFAYLYRSEGGEQQEPEALQPGTPRTSHHQVTRVGERRPPQQSPTGGYGYPQPSPPSSYGAQQQQYGADPTQQYGAQPYGQPQQPSYEAPPPGGGHRGGHQGGPDAPNRKGLMIAAVAVVAVVAIVIAIAMTNSPGDGDNEADSKQTTSAVSTAPSTDPSTTRSATATPFSSAKVDVATLALSGGAQTSTKWTGADASGGTYVDHMGTVGAAVTWKVTVPEDGSYTFFISYGNAGADANLTLAINGTPRADPVNLKNYGKYTAWDKAWSNHTYSWVDLKKGANTLSLTCMPNTNCGINLDQVWLKTGQVTE